MLRSLRTQILVWTILPLAILLVGIAYLGVSNHQGAMRELVAERDAALARVAAARLSELLIDRARDIENLDAARPETWDTQIFEGGIALLDSEGRIVNALPSREVWEARRDKIARKDEYSKPFLENGAWLVLLTHPNQDGTLVAAVQLPSFETFAPRGAAYLVDGNGKIIAHPDSARVGMDFSTHAGIAQVMRGESGATFHHNSQVGELVVGYAPIAATRWGLLIDEPWENVVAPMFQYAVLLPVVLALVAVVALGAIYFGVRYVIRPLENLVQAAQRIAFGDYHAAAQRVGGVREIEELRETLDSMANQVSAAQVAMQNYITAITHSQEDERKHLARELHDDTIQTLIAVQQRIEMAQRALNRDPARAASKLDELKVLTTEAVEHVRGFVRDLRPTYLDELGLIPALETIAREANASFTVQGEEKRWDAERELVLFRITQEALRNVSKHARASQVDVTLAFAADEVTVTIQDNGRGFDAPESPNSYARAGHFGLMGMQERAQLFGGNVYVKSERDKGTKVVAYLPTKNSAA
ncbi:HAMP domain-containing protein [Anaerolineae bacterium CFX7]|nr:HAMP domain-containing protein [Anaerolineae bacterium CFX7]